MQVNILPRNPLISFVILAYNQERFIRRAVEGAFAQTYSPLEIIISDDCSSDSTFEIIEEMALAYSGPHRIVLNRNIKNMGLGMHFNRVMELSNGEIIIAAAGDDISLPHRTERSLQIFHANHRLMAVSLGIHRFTDESLIDNIETKNDNIIKTFDISHYIADTHFHINAPARAFKKEVFDCFGPLDTWCPVEDGPILFRCLLLGEVAQASEVGVLYRIHGNNMYASENKYFIDYDSIYRNYFIDLEIARKKNLVSQNLANQAKMASKNRLKRDVLKKRLWESRNKTIFFLRYMLFSSFFSGRAKLMHLKMGLNSDIYLKSKFITLKRNYYFAVKYKNAFKTVIRNWLGLSDYERWRNQKSLSKAWDGRTKKIASLIPDSTSSVIEFGAGRMTLANLIPTGCKYTPSDIVDRGNDTIVCDLNSSKLPKISQYDVAVFSGVLEYVKDLSGLLLYLSKFINIFVVSYAPTDTIPQLINRRYHGWVNDYSIKQLNDLFEKNHYICDHLESWRDQIIARYRLAEIENKNEKII